MSDSEEDFASADEGDIDGGTHKDPKVKASEKSTAAEPAAAAGTKPDTENTSQDTADATKKEPAKGKGGGKGKEQQKKKGNAGGKAADTKTVPKASDKPSDAGTKSKGQKRNDKGKKGSQKVTSNADKDSEKEKVKSKVKDSAGSTDEKVEGSSKSDVASESENQVGEESATVNTAEPDNTPTSESKVGEESATVKPAERENTPECENKVSEESATVKPAEPDNTPESGSKVGEESATVKSAEPENTPDSEKPDNAVTKTTGENTKTPVKQTDNSTSKDAEDGTLIKSPSTQCIARPEADHTSEQECVLSKLAESATEKKSGWGWGWGSSLLDVASTSVSTFTSQVGEGFHTMMETVESSMNVPNPEEMAEENVKSSQGQDEGTEKASGEGQASGKDNEKSSFNKGTSKSAEASAGESPAAGAENQPKGADSDNWFSSWGVSNITKMVENTSKSLVTGSLDVLETIGKKTFDVINEHDPGLKKTRGLVKDRGDKPNLSAMLRDAKDQYETRVEQEKETEEARKSHFGALFDDFQGLAHLEALEMLSNQSEKRVNALLGALSPDQVGALKPLLLQLRKNFEMEEEEDEGEETQDQDFVKLVTAALADLAIPTSPDKLIKTREKIYESLTQAQAADGDETSHQPKEIHQVAIQSLAEFTSKSIEHFHKFGELVLLHQDKQPDLVTTSNQLHSLTKILCAEVSIMSTKFTDTLNKLEGGEVAIAINQFVTNIYLEASNSCSYIQDGFQLLLPVLQQAAMEHSQSMDS